MAIFIRILEIEVARNINPQVRETIRYNVIPTPSSAPYCNNHNIGVWVNSAFGPIYVYRKYFRVVRKITTPIKEDFGFHNDKWISHEDELAYETQLKLYNSVK